MTKPQWEIEWRNLFWLHRIPKYTKRAKDIELFIRSQIEKSYQQGVEDMRRKCVEEIESTWCCSECASALLDEIKNYKPN